MKNNPFRQSILRSSSLLPAHGGSWHKAQELRFRAHQVESFGQEPGRQPYLNMLLEPTRAKFLRRLEKFVARKQQKDDSFSSIGALQPRPPCFTR